MLMMLARVGWAVENAGADAHDVGVWAGQLKMRAADAHDAGPCGLGS